MEWVLMVALVVGNGIQVPDRFDQFATYSECQNQQVNMVQDNREIFANGRLILVCDKIKK